MNLNFDATKVDPAQALMQLPISDANGHPVVITASEFKPVKDDTTNQYGYLQLELTIIDGPHKGESGPYRLNLYNKEPKAVEIAQRQLSAICHVTGVMYVPEPSVLHNIPFRAIVQLQKGQEAGGYTEVKGVKDINGNDPRKGGAAQPQQQQQQVQQPVQQQQQAPGFGQQPQPQQGAGGWGPQPGQQQQPVQQPQGGFQGQQQQPVQGQGFQQQQPVQQPNPSAWGQGQQPQQGAAGAAPWGPK